MRRFSTGLLLIMFLICMMIPFTSLIVEAGDSIALQDSEDNDPIEIQEPVAVTVTDYVEILKNDVMTITPILTPVNAITQLTFFSSDETIVHVVPSGIGYTFNILAVNEGRATITIITDNGLIAKCVVNVIDSPDPIHISIDDLEIHQGESRYLTVYRDPTEAIILFENIVSDDVSIATTFTGGGASSVGVYGVNEGSTIITVRTANGLEASFVLTVIASPEPEIIEIPETYHMKEGESWDIPIQITPQEAFTRLLTSSENRDIAIATSTGAYTGSRVYGKNAGIVDVTVSTDNGLSAICKITVEHDWEDDIIKIEATSEHEGGLVRRCKVCGHISCVNTHDEINDPAVPPTCTETGLTEGKHCAICGEVLIAQKTIEELPHTEEKVEGKPATCTEDGLTDGVKCSVCGEILVEQETIQATGHTKETITGKPATCTEDGLTDGVKCSVCGEILVEQEIIQATGHTKETITGKPATCTEDGLTDGTKCSICGELLAAQEEIAALGHSWDAGKVTKEPTATATGVRTYTCKRCGTTKTETIPKLDATVLIGDVNQDGEVNATDRMILSRYLAGWEGYGTKIKSMDAADIDRNSKVEAKDRMILARYLAGWTGYDTYFK